MGIFKRGARLDEAGPLLFKIKITTVSGKVHHWHKRGELHLIERDVAEIFVRSFKPELFQVRADGSLSPPEEGVTERIAKVEMERS